MEVPHLVIGVVRYNLQTTSNQREILNPDPQACRVLAIGEKKKTSNPYCQEETPHGFCLPSMWRRGGQSNHRQRYRACHSALCPVQSEGRLSSAPCRSSN